MDDHTLTALSPWSVGSIVSSSSSTAGVLPLFMHGQFLRTWTSRKFCFISDYLFSRCCMDVMLWIQVVSLLGCEARSLLAQPPEACLHPQSPVLMHTYCALSLFWVLSRTDEALLRRVEAVPGMSLCDWIYGLWL